MTKKNESGAVMVEATIYFPIVILLVALIICISMAKVEESILFFYTDKVASMATNAVKYPGYEKLISDSDIGMAAGIKNLPSEANVKEYYLERCNKVYNWGFVYSEKDAAYSQKLKNLVTGLYFVGGGIIDPQCVVDIKGGLVPRAEVNVVYSLHLPHMFEYLAGEGNSLDTVKIGARSRSVAINATEFVRNIDIVYDLGKYLADKLGISDDITGAMEKLGKIKDKLI